MPGWTKETRTIGRLTLRSCCTAGCIILIRLIDVHVAIALCRLMLLLSRLLWHWRRIVGRWIEARLGSYGSWIAAIRWAIVVSIDGIGGASVEWRRIMKGDPTIAPTSKQRTQKEKRSSVYAHRLGLSFLVVLSSIPRL